MNKLNSIVRKYLLSRWGVVGIISIFCLSIAISLLAFSVPTSTEVSANELTIVEKLNNAPDVPLKIEQDDDAPLRILSANIKFAPARDFEGITGMKAMSASVPTVPFVEMVNVSNRVISRVTFTMEDRSMQKAKGLIIKERNIKPGERFFISRENFVGGFDPESRQRVANPIRSPRFWLAFPDAQRVSVSVNVTFDDGTKWFNRNQKGGTE